MVDRDIYLLDEMGMIETHLPDKIDIIDTHLPVEQGILLNENNIIETYIFTWWNGNYRNSYLPDEMGIIETHIYLMKWEL